MKAFKICVATIIGSAGLGGCWNDNSHHRRTEAGAASSSSNEYANNAQDAARRADLHIPAGATNVKFSRVSIDHASEAYYITFDVAKKHSGEIRAALGEQEHFSAMQAYVKNVFKDFPVSSKSIGYNGSSPKDSGWWYHSLVNPGDPTHVGVFVEYVSR